MTMASKVIAQKSPRRSESPDPVDIHVGKRLRLRRNLLGMSQEQLGTASGLTFQQIQKYERGANRMGASRLYQLGKLLKVSVSYFFDEMPAALSVSSTDVPDTEQAPLEGAENGTELLQRRETMELIRTYYRITDAKQRRAVFNMIKSMAPGSAE